MTHTTRFGPLLVRYDERVLRPRPWTRMQSRWGAELAAELPPGPVLELCAGVGHIGLLLASLVDRDLVLVDADRAACAYARRNAAAAGLSARVEVRNGRLDTAVEAGERFALILADPPWVASAETWRHPADPTFAIDGGDDGLALARACVDVIGRHLGDGGVAILQVGDELQADRIRAHVEARAWLELAPGEVRTDPDGGGVLVELARQHQRSRRALELRLERRRQ